VSQCPSHMVIYLIQLDEVIIKATPNNNKLTQDSLTLTANHQIFPPQVVQPPFSNRQSTENRNKPTTIACTARRGKKVKCDSRRPTCSQCQEDGQLSCNHVRWKKTGLPRGYVRTLEAQKCVDIPFSESSS
jgi:hypothetical protein